MQTNTLFSPLELGAVSLRNRIVMAPTTRMRAKMPGNIPWELNATYYRQRASAGLIISIGNYGVSAKRCGNKPVSEHPQGERKSAGFQKGRGRKARSLARRGNQRV